MIQCLIVYEARRPTKEFLSFVCTGHHIFLYGPCCLK